MSTDASSPRGTLGGCRRSGKVTIDGDIKLLSENESIYIPRWGDALPGRRGKFRSI
ncbi:hypothetical protein OHD50_23655 [Escherichia coli]|nr:hypothetical protein [Escherichia coli]